MPQILLAKLLERFLLDIFNMLEELQVGYTIDSKRIIDKMKKINKVIKGD